MSVGIDNADGCGTKVGRKHEVVNRAGRQSARRLPDGNCFDVPETLEIDDRNGVAAQIGDVDMGKRRDGTQVQVAAAPGFGDEGGRQQQVPQPAAQALTKHHDSKGERAGRKGEILRAILTIHAAVWISGPEGKVYSSLDLSSFSLYMK